MALDSTQAGVPLGSSVTPTQAEKAERFLRLHRRGPRC